MRPRYSFVIPVYNSVESLGELVERIHVTVHQELGLTYEIVFVDDASPRQETWSRLRELAATNPAVRAFRLMRNFGKAGAILCGFEQSQGDFIITLDDDMQHRPEDLIALESVGDHDVVMGVFLKKQHGLFTRLTSWAKGKVDQWLIGKPSGVQMSPYKKFRRNVVDAMLAIQTPNPFIPALMFYVTNDVVTVPIQHEPRTYGKSAFTFRKRFKQFSNLVFNNSSALLRLIAGFGALMSFVSLTAGLVVLWRGWVGDIAVPGWTSLMFVMLVLSGLILFALGISGEYLIRIINGVEQRPPYIVRDACDATDRQTARKKG